ncbi:MAG: COX15/CtaA family protein [Chloroflexota bacterium]
MTAITKSFKVFSLWSVAITFLLIVVGGVVRVTGSGDACPDWPTCYGSFIPPFELRIWIEWTHRLVNTLVAPSVLILAVWATLKYRGDKLIFRGAWLSVFLLIMQIVLGGLVVILQLPPALVGIHLANALLIFAALITISLHAHRPWANVSATSDPSLRRLIVWSALAVYALIFSGSVVTGTNSLAACLGWPLCNGDIVPATVPQTINIVHRYFAAAVGILLFYTLSETLRRHRANRLLRRAAHTAIGLFALQVIVGGVNVLTLFNQFWNGLHLATATAVFGAMVAFAVIGWHTLRQQAAASHPSSVIGERAEMGD